MTEYSGQPADLPGILRWQAAACGGRTPLYQHLLTAAAADVEDGGPTGSLLAPYADRPAATVPALRLLGAVHRLVLAGQAPEVAAYFPSVGGGGSPEAAWPAVRRLLSERSDELTALLQEPVQTNETGRSAVLYAGLLTLVHHTGLAVRLLEIGASAGLNLRADRFAYRAADGSVYGDSRSPLVLDDPWRGTPAAPLNTQVRVVERRGCDPLPIDPTEPAGRLRLESLVWADQTDRLARLRAAIAVAEQVPATVDQTSDTAAWLADRLAEAVPGTVTLVWHSVMRQYVDPAEWQAIEALLTDVGEHASSDTPLAVLGFEPESNDPDHPFFPAWLTTWPGGEATLLGTGDGHGMPFEWRAGQ